MNWQSALEEDGYCVVPGVVPDFERVRDSIWTDLMRLVPGFDPSVTAPREQRRALFSLYPLHSMLLQHYVGHMQSVWNVRQHPAVHRVFEQIWGTEDLYVSFDGISALVPPETTGRGFLKPSTANWLHVDQSPHKTGRWSVQGFVNLYDVDDMDASLLVVPGSHLEDRSGLAVRGQNTTDWLMMTDRADDARKVVAKAGDLVLWDSRTIHQGSLPSRGRPTARVAPTGLMAGHEYSPRLVVYVCMLPRLRLTNLQKRKRAEALEKRRMTNHWGTKLFPLAPRRYGGPVPTIVAPPAPTLTALGESLV